MNTAASQLNRKTRRRDADSDLVQPHAVGPSHTESDVAREQQECAHREGMPLHHTDGRERKGHQAECKLRTEPDHFQTFFRIARSEYLQVKTSRKNTGTSRAYHDHIGFGF